MPGKHAGPVLEEIGCYARIADWDGLAGGKLGIVIEGETRFHLNEANQADDNLYWGEVDFISDKAEAQIPSQYAHLLDVLEDLQNYPGVRKIKYQLQADRADVVSCQLAQLLPIDEAEKYEMLEMHDANQRLARLSEILQNLH